MKRIKMKAFLHFMLVIALGKYSTAPLLMTRSAASNNDVAVTPQAIGIYNGVTGVE